MNTFAGVREDVKLVTADSGWLRRQDLPSRRLSVWYIWDRLVSDEMCQRPRIHVKQCNQFRQRLNAKTVSALWWQLHSPIISTLPYFSAPFKKKKKEKSIFVLTLVSSRGCFYAWHVHQQRKKKIIDWKVADRDRPEEEFYLGFSCCYFWKTFHWGSTESRSVSLHVKVHSQKRAWKQSLAVMNMLPLSATRPGFTLVRS